VLVKPRENLVLELLGGHKLVIVSNRNIFNLVH
jgi:hypothetical protein